MIVRYFAYGSNMSTARLLSRAPSARVEGIGLVTGRRLVFHKRGRDGSGKADAMVTDDPHSVVWGVVYLIEERHRAALDRAEGGYWATPVQVVLNSCEVADCFLYQADPRPGLDPRLRPLPWYKACLVDGAREHRLPEPYLRELEAWEALRDPSRGG